MSKKSPINNPTSLVIDLFSLAFFSIFCFLPFFLTSSLKKCSFYN